MKKQKKVIIFDYDGTLYNGDVLKGWGKYVKDFLSNYIGEKEAEDFIKRHGFESFNVCGQKIAGALVQDFGTAKALYEQQDKHNYVLKSSDLKYVDSNIIKNLKKYAKIYIVSNSPVSHVVNNSKNNNFDISFADGIYANQFNPKDVSKNDIYVEILNKEKAKPENVFVVGDSVENDIVPAKKLGFNTLLVKTIKDIETVELFVKKPIVKICANKSIEDAKMCLSAYADLIGFLVGRVHSSSDFIDKETAKEIVNFVNGRVGCVLVTHLTSAKEIIELSKFIGNDYIQLHSEISECEVEKIVESLPNVKLIRLVHVGQDGKVETDFSKFRFVDFYLLDSFNKQTNQVGGTGLVHDLKTDKKLVQELYKPVFIAGGLNPENVANAIKVSNPAGVDVNSGCTFNGIKNAKLVKTFVKNAKNC